MKKAKERIIFDNYDLWDTYPDEYLKEIALECDWIDDEDEITDDLLTKWRYQEAEVDWDCEKERLEEFFDKKEVIFFGTVGRWDGDYKGGMMGNFWDIYWKAVKDCDYIKIYDANGHFYIQCSHHDGTNFYEVKEVTQKGSDYFDRWSWDLDDKRTLREVHTQIIKKYSKLPRFAEKVYGAKEREYEKEVA